MRRRGIGTYLFILFGPCVLAANSVAGDANVAEFGGITYDLPCRIFLHQQMRGFSDEDPDLWMDWFKFDPLVKIDGQFVYQSNTHLKITVAQTVYRQEILTGYWRPKSKAEWLAGYDAVYSRQAFLVTLARRYGEGRIAKLIHHLNEVEGELYLQRMEFGLVRAKGGQILGGIRVYDGTAKHYPTDPATPSEVSFRMRQMPAPEFSALRQDPAVPLFEFGNFFIVDLPPAEQLRVKAVLWKMVQVKYLDRFPNARIIAHVVDPVNRRRNLRDYGMRELSVHQPPEGSPEFMLESDSATFRSYLERFFRQVTR